MNLERCLNRLLMILDPQTHQLKECKISTFMAYSYICKWDNESETGRFTQILCTNFNLKKVVVTFKIVIIISRQKKTTIKQTISKQRRQFIWLNTTELNPNICHVLNIPRVLDWLRHSRNSAASSKVSRLISILD